MYIYIYSRPVSSFLKTKELFECRVFPKPSVTYAACYSWEIFSAEALHTQILPVSGRVCVCVCVFVCVLQFLARFKNAYWHNYNLANLQRDTHAKNSCCFGKIRLQYLYTTCRSLT